MFVPRALRLKGTKESEKVHAKAPPKGQDTGASATKGSPQASNSRAGPQYTTPVITSEHLGHLVCGTELLFTDYAHQDEGGARWLTKHTRDIDGEKGYVHLSAVLEHPNIALLKPAATQISLQRALQEQYSPYLELSKDGYLVRRRPSTYPLHFIPHNSFDVTNDEGLSFWDQRTIYVEPHTRDLCKTPAKVAYWLKEHGQLRGKWLPVQAVHTLYNSCAFVVLSGNVTHQGTWQKWRAVDKPEFWKIMTKTEHTKRTVEYADLLNEEKTASKQTNAFSTTPQNTMADMSTPTTPESNDPPGNKRPAQEDAEPVPKKRKRGKKKKKDVAGEGQEVETSTNGHPVEQSLGDDAANGPHSADSSKETTLSHHTKTARLKQKNAPERDAASSVG